MTAVTRRIEEELQALNCHLLDLYLQQRACYRELVAAGAHRGIPVPEPPVYRSQRGSRASAATSAPYLAGSGRVIHRLAGHILRVY